MRGTACERCGTPRAMAQGSSLWVVLENAGVEPVYSKPSQAAQMTQQNFKTVRTEEFFKGNS